MKRIFIVHGWSGSPNRDWIPWLKNELIQRGYEVQTLNMPLTYIPLTKLWLPYFRFKVGRIDENTYFIGHSLGCRAIMFLVASQKRKSGGALFVGGFAGGWSYVSFPYNPFLSFSARVVIMQWLIKKVNFTKLRALLLKSTVILSDNDPLIPFEKNKKAFEERLGSKIVVVSGKGHFTYGEIGESLPEILNEALEILK